MKIKEHPAINWERWLLPLIGTHLPQDDLDSAKLTAATGHSLKPNVPLDHLELTLEHSGKSVHGEPAGQGSSLCPVALRGAHKPLYWEDRNGDWGKERSVAAFVKHKAVGTKEGQAGPARCAQKVTVLNLGSVIR